MVAPIFRYPVVTDHSLPDPSMANAMLALGYGSAEADGKP
jgi:hypothetical protein